MALQQTTVDHRTEDLLRAMVLIVAAIAAVVILTAIFGMSGTSPSLDLVPDPAGLHLF